MKVSSSLSFAAILLGMSVNSALAQDYTDALRYAYLMPQGTARSMGYGNASGSFGSDFSSVAINPAGLGLYRSGELMFTPNIQTGTVNGKYLGATASDNNTHFSFSNAGVVFTSSAKGKRAESNNWKSVSFAVGVNKLADFNRDYRYNGNNSGQNSSSQSELFAADLNNFPADTLTDGTLASLGKYGNLIDSAGNTIVPWKNGINQNRMVQERGGTNEVDIALGGNYRDKLMLGITLGIPIINHSINAYYTESALNADPNFTSYRLAENYTTTGAGINGKFGAIYKFSDYFRIGAAIHTPTYYAMHDESTVVLTNNGTPTTGGVQTLPNTYVMDYHLTTPWRAVLSATGFIGAHGFITADYEYVDYSTAKFDFGSNFNNGNLQDVQANANQLIKQNLKAASNFRLGVEVHITPVFVLRTGAGYYGSPYTNTNGVNCSSTVLSGGFGFRFPRFFIDASYMHTQYNGLEQPYATPYTNVTVYNATLQNSISNAAITFGFKFRS
jgi:hypothetical protein